MKFFYESLKRNRDNQFDQSPLRTWPHFFEDFGGQILGKLYPTGSNFDPKSAALYKKIGVPRLLKNFKFTTFLEEKSKTKFEFWP